MCQVGLKCKQAVVAATSSANQEQVNTEGSQDPGLLCGSDRFLPCITHFPTPALCGQSHSCEELVPSSSPIRADWRWVCAVTYCVLSVHALGVLAEAVAELLALFLSPLHRHVLAQFLDTAAAVLLHLLPGAPSELHTEHAALVLLRTTGKSINSESPQTTRI